MKVAIRTLAELGPEVVLAPERYLADAGVGEGTPLGDLVTLRAAPPPAVDAPLILDTTHARDGILDIASALRAPATAKSTKKGAAAGDVIVSRLRPYLRQIAYVHPRAVEAAARPLAVSSEFYVLTPKSGASSGSANSGASSGSANSGASSGSANSGASSGSTNSGASSGSTKSESTKSESTKSESTKSESIAFLVPFLLSPRVQAILAAAQEGGHHPRVPRASLLALRVPPEVLAARAKSSREVERSLDAVYRAHADWHALTTTG